MIPPDGPAGVTVSAIGLNWPAGHEVEIVSCLGTTGMDCALGSAELAVTRVGGDGAFGVPVRAPDVSPSTFDRLHCDEW